MKTRPQLKDIPDIEVIRIALERHAAIHSGASLALLRGGSDVAAVIANRFCVDYKLALCKVERLSDRGLLEYGVSARFAWPTPEGYAALGLDYWQEIERYRAAKAARV